MFDILNNKWVDFPVTILCDYFFISNSVINKGTKSIEVTLESSYTGYSVALSDSERGIKQNIFSFDRKYIPYNHKTNSYTMIESTQKGGPISNKTYFSYTYESGSHDELEVVFTINSNTNISYCQFPFWKKGTTCNLHAGSPIKMKWQYLKN